MIRPLLFTVALVTLAVSLPAKGGEPAEPLSPKSVLLDERAVADGWDAELTLTLWTVNMDGVMGVRGLVVPVNVSFEDVLDSLNFVIAGVADIRKEDSRVGLFLAGSYIELGPDISPVPLPAGTVNGITVEQVMASAALYYRAADWGRGHLDVLGGAGYIYMKNTLEFSSGGSAGGSASWVDPFAGLRGKQYLTDKLYAQGVAEIGGFGAGSELTWNVGGGVGYDFTDRFAMNFFYRYMSIDYDDDILFDVDMNGLFLGLKFTF